MNLALGAFFIAVLTAAVLMFGIMIEHGGKHRRCRLDPTPIVCDGYR